MRSTVAVLGLVALGLMACNQIKAKKTTTVASASASVVASASAAPAQETAVETQTKALRGFVEAFNKHDADAIARFYATDAVFVELGAEAGESKGTAAITGDYKTIFQGFPDAKIAVTRSWHMGDVVAIEFVEGGTGTGDDDTNRKFGYVGASLLWFDATGKVKRDQTYYDDLTMEVQLGWAKPPFSRMEVRPVREVPAFSGSWEQHVATGSADEGKIVAVRDKLYSNVLTANGEKDFLAILTDDVVLAEYDDPRDAPGKKGVAEAFKDWHKTFSNMKMESTHTWPCGEYVIFEGTFAGKITGPWGPLKPSNKTFNSHFLDITRITQDGKVDRMWTYASSSEILGLRKGEPPK